MFAKIKTLPGFVIILLSLLISACAAPTEEVQIASAIPPTASPQTATIEDALDDYITQSNFSGSILIANGHELLINAGYGFADQETSMPNTPQTIFRIGSITKQITAMGILIFQEEGKLDVQDLICDFVSNCPQSWQAITIHHLLTHSSGIPNYSAFPDFDFEMNNSVIELIDTFIDRPLSFQPGSKFSYSNSGYILLGLIIDQLSDIGSYEDYLQERIFQPLAMSNSGYENNDQNLNNQASGYVREDNDNLRDADYLDMSNPYSAGALYSTVEDLYLWDRALYSVNLVSRRSLETMFTDYIGDYGYGWISTRIAGRNVFTHNGNIHGFSSEIARFVEEDVVIIILSNVENEDTSRMLQALAGIIF